MSNKVQDPDDHLVIHDVASLGIAGVFGLVGTAVTGSPEVGLAATSVITATGIAGMRVGPVRRAINGAAIALSQAKKNDEKDA